MRYTFPHDRSPLKSVQPDYVAWQSVVIGASREEVIERLGPPIDDKTFRGRKARMDDPYFYYGYLQLPMLPHPRTYCFSIGFDEQHRVIGKNDPFNGRFSSDGSPLSPELITPFDRSAFSHFPRIVDMRWYPVSGAYPMTYTVEMGWCTPLNPGDSLAAATFHDEEVESELKCPFFMTTFPGGQPGRFRIRATNDAGYGPWSEHRYFWFTR